MRQFSPVCVSNLGRMARRRIFEIDRFALVFILFQLIRCNTCASINQSASEKYLEDVTINAAVGDSLHDIKDKLRIVREEQFPSKNDEAVADLDRDLIKEVTSDRSEGHKRDKRFAPLVFAVPAAISGAKAILIALGLITVARAAQEIGDISRPGKMGWSYNPEPHRQQHPSPVAIPETVFKYKAPPADLEEKSDFFKEKKLTKATPKTRIDDKRGSDDENEERDKSKGKKKQRRPKEGDEKVRLRKRWKDPEGKIYEWDYDESELEIYDRFGKNHEGGHNPYTGKLREGSVRPGRTVEP